MDLLTTSIGAQVSYQVAVLGDRILVMAYQVGTVSLG